MESTVPPADTSAWRLPAPGCTGIASACRSSGSQLRIARVIGIEDLVIDRLAACVETGAPTPTARGPAFWQRTHAGRLDRTYLLETADTLELREHVEQLLQDIGS